MIREAIRQNPYFIRETIDQMPIIVDLLSNIQWWIVNRKVNVCYTFNDKILRIFVLLTNNSEAEIVQSKEGMEDAHVNILEPAQQGGSTANSLLGFSSSPSASLFSKRRQYT
jgi:hypothetical protein